MNKDPALYIEHILKSIDLIEKFTNNMSKENFVADVMRYDAVLYNLQTISESTQKLPQSIKDRNSYIPWKDISGFRNILVHDYLGDIDDNIVWLVITTWLPLLKEAMIEIQHETKNKR